MRRLLIAAFLTAVFLGVFTGCSTMKPLKGGLSPELVLEKINPGDEIIVHTRDSGRHMIVVESIDRDEIAGSGKTFRYEEIDEIHTEEFAILETVGATYLGIMAYALLVITVALAIGM